MKVCIDCKRQKEDTEFYLRKENNKYRNNCKDCVKEISKARTIKIRSDPSLLQKERERSKAKYKRLYRTSLFDRGYSYSDGETNRTIFPEKFKAADATKKIRKDGYHCHHWSYNTEHRKDIIYLTVKEHQCAHRFIVYDRERMMYRRYDNNELLDTKEAHEKWIIWCIENKEEYHFKTT